MLKVDDLGVRYGRVPAVHSISFAVTEGEIVAIVGPNGAGKSTTLAAVTGTITPFAGTIDFLDQTLIGLSPERIVRNGIALVPEGRQIFSSLSVAENLQLGTTARKDRAEAREDLENTLERFPILRTYYRASAAKLSGGEQQQLAIARALLARPKLLLLDEPSLGLAPIMIDRVFETLEELRGTGMTILLVEQNATRAVALADRTYVLRTGRVAFSGEREELLRTTDFAAAYLGT
ncbi:MAG: ABC transporter ATP-binding protein [Gaiellaceae bacterium]|jgi:branched-chain amino acid transport system ATP-binding protein